MKLLAIASLAASVSALGFPFPKKDRTSSFGTAWNVRKFTNLITFGDSYTDENRLGYFLEHNGQAPPVGTVLPMSFSTAGGGITWGRWVSIYSKAEYFDYAVSGAFCDNSYALRYTGNENSQFPFPDVMGYEIPAFLAETKYTNPKTGSNTVYANRRADNTVYALWIGTNDLGNGAFLTDSNFAGTTLTNYTHCIFKAFDAMYSAGGRNFVLMNLAPLQLSPQYNINGTGPNHYFPDKGNGTEVGYKVLEYTTLANRLFSYQVPYELYINDRYPGAAFAIYDVHSLITDIFNNPVMYLNGTSPLNVTGYYHHCDMSGSNCYNLPGADLDSFLWYDELHPSERVDQIIAENFIDIVKGHSKYATYW
ncbi:hypothetical protein VTN00DRAFT_2915 [Thermoascus crustaceus]|uniref:uncharacterized protein n=1 Tax=Thermoascus crustaceus TaxID=5088 RepID=UPI0037421EB0